MQRISEREMRKVEAGGEYAKKCSYCGIEERLGYIGPITKAFATWWCEDRIRKHIYEEHYNTFLE